MSATGLRSTDDYALALADDALVAAQRMGEWIAAAPQLEEDVALGNIALDLLGQARSLLAYAGSLADPPRTEDDLAYLRDERAFRNVQLVERAASARLRRWRWRGCWSCRPTSASSTPRSGPRAPTRRSPRSPPRRSRRSTTTATTPPCGCSGSATAPRSRTRGCRPALEAEWPLRRGAVRRLVRRPRARRTPASPSTRRRCATAFDGRVTAVLARGDADAAPRSRAAVTGGRRGVHTEQMGYLLAEMQHLARSHPGATW